MTDSDFMKLALSLAENGRGFTSPNPMVGAVVVKDGRIIGRGWHQKAGGPHAEVHAIDDAGPEARGADLYVTLEPCNHHGRTPPCTKKILAAGIRRVVVAMDDPNPDVAGGGAEFLKQQGITVISGVCENDARRLNEFFITHVRKRRPFVILKTAATLDGRIATRTGDSRWVTGERARAHVHEIRHAVDAIMVGVNTILTDDPSLTTRREGGKPGVNPRRFILDTRLSVPDNAKVLRIPPASDTVIVTGFPPGRGRNSTSEYRTRNRSAATIAPSAPVSVISTTNSSPPSRKQEFIDRKLFRITSPIFTSTWSPAVWP